MGTFIDDMLGRYGYPEGEYPEPDDEIVCKFCDTPYLQWKETRGEHNRKKWALVDAAGNIHDCRNQAKLIDFPVC